MQISKFKALILSICFIDRPAEIDKGIPLLIVKYIYIYVCVCVFACMTRIYLKRHVPLLIAKKLYVCVCMYSKF